MSTVPIPIWSKPGISRDSTNFQNDTYNDGQWVRWNALGLPTKIAGYTSVTSRLNEKVYGMDAYVFGATNYLHLGSQTFLTQVQTDLAGNLGTQGDRTPAGFTPNAANVWQFDYLSLNATNVDIIANAGQNLVNIGNNIETPIYFGLVSGTGPLIASGMPNVSGGVVVLSPFLIGYSNGGRIDVSKPNDPTATLGSAFVTDQKIVNGLPLRNGSGGPAGLLWSLNALLIMTFNTAITTGV